MAERMTRLLNADLAALELRFKDNGPDAEGSSPNAVKARVEAVSQIARTLEKLLDLKRLEALAQEAASGEDEAETAKLRKELMSRLRAVDARRFDGAGLFSEEEA